MTLLAVLVLGFLFFEAVIFASHWLMHQRWTGLLWRSHHLHHQLYNPRHPATDEFKPAGWRSFRFQALIFVIVALAVLWFVPFAISIPLLIEFSALSYITNEIHNATHTTGHWLEIFGWYRQLKREHWIHHANVKKNLGVLTFFYDRLAKSYAKR